MSAPKIPAAPVKGTRTADTWPTRRAKSRLTKRGTRHR
jgi:hypothetical protein